MQRSIRVSACLLALLALHALVALQGAAPADAFIAPVGTAAAAIAATAKASGAGEARDHCHGKCHRYLDTSLGPMTNFSLGSLQPLAYLFNASLVLLDNFTVVPDITVTAAFDSYRSRAYINTLGTEQWFLANGTYTYIASMGACFLQVAGGTYADLVQQYSGLLFSTSFKAHASKKHHCDHHHHHHHDDDDDDDSHDGRNDNDARESKGECHPSPKVLDQYEGLITLTELPNAVVMTVDRNEVIHAMIATGPQDECQLLGGVYSVSYSLYEYAPIGLAPWSDFPSLPAQCLGGGVIPYSPRYFQPAYCSALSS